jgi:hypothetical protein
MVYVHGGCDIAVNTTIVGSHECAVAMVNALSVVTSPKAFDRLRRRRA